MFWKNFILLCNKKGIAPNTACAEMGYSTAIATKWKNGSVPRSTTLQKIADYFGVTVEYLLRDNDTVTNNENSMVSEIKKKCDALTEEEAKKAKEYFEFLISQRKNNPTP